MKDKSQITMEFLLINGFLLLICILFIAIYGTQLKEFSDNKERAIIDEFGMYLKKEIDLASIVKEGYERTIEVPEQIDGRIDYTLEMNRSTIVILTDEHSFSAVIPNTVGKLEKGENIIRKENNTVNIEQI